MAPKVGGFESPRSPQESRNMKPQDSNHPFRRRMAASISRHEAKKKPLLGTQQRSVIISCSSLLLEGKESGWNILSTAQSIDQEFVSSVKTEFYKLYEATQDIDYTLRCLLQHDDPRIKEFAGVLLWADSVRRQRR